LESLAGESIANSRNQTGCRGSVITFGSGCNRLGCVHLVGIDLNHLANVWHRQSLLAAVALCVATTIIINSGRANTVG